MKLLNLLAVLSLTLTSFSSSAEPVSTAQNWQTFETENFRVHYTPEYKQWALSSAREMEKVRTLIKQQQGRVLTEKVDTYIIDPFNAANGFAIPLSNAPYMTLFATPPQSDSIIANSTGWQQLLVLHEYVHLVHLGQKDRANWRNNIANWFDLYDASQITDHRWVSEGYATLLESKLTGRGRLYNNAVEAIIHQFAREGALPTYAQLSEINEDYLSGSMAYLLGVRYLKWLEENYGEDTLDAVWTRWRAVKKRNFEQAFEGVFQDSAKHLYQRFVAEYTFKAMKKEQSLPKTPSTLWLDLKGHISAPSMSPNGEYLAIIDKSRKADQSRKITLTVYNTADNLKKQQEFEKDVADLLKADPHDIASKAPITFKRKQAFTLNQINYGGISNPRWLNNSTIIYGASTVDSDNNRHQDLFSWHITTNTIKQLTNSANIRRFDIVTTNKNNAFIIAERSRYGSSQLVKLAIDGQFIKALTASSLTHVYDFPRVKPKQAETTNSTTSFAYLQSALNEKWLLKVSQLDATNNTITNTTIVPLPQGYQFLSFPEWSKDGKNIFYVAGIDGQTKLFQYDFSKHILTALTSGQQAISWPVVIDNNKLLHLATNSKGPDVYQLKSSDTSKDIVAKTTQNGIVTSNLASQHKADKAEIIVDESIGSYKSYGLGPQQGTITLGASYNSVSSNLVELGYKSSDAIKRFDWQVNISQDIFSNTLSGYGVNIRWQGWPVKLTGHAYQFDLKPQQQSSTASPLYNIDEQGLQLQASYPYRNNAFTLNTIGQVKTAEVNSLSTKYAAIGFNQVWFHEQQVWGLKQKASLHYLSGEYETIHSNTNKTNDYNGSNGSLTITGHYNAFYLGFDYAWAERSSDAGILLSLGGFNSTLIQPKAHLNKQFSPELAFYRLFANDYKKLTAFIPFKGVNGFYTRHEMSEQIVIDSYGIKGQITNSFGFTGINDIVIDFGIAQVKPENKRSETQAWLGLRHQW